MSENNDEIFNEICDYYNDLDLETIAFLADFHNLAFDENSENPADILLDNLPLGILIQNMEANKNDLHLYKSNLYYADFVKESEDNKIFVSENGICNCFYYIPYWVTSNFYEPYSKELSNQIKLSNKVLKYKEDNYSFTDELIEAIVHICNYCFKDIDEICLVSVPASDTYHSKDPQTKKSIDEIVDYFKEGKLESDFGCSKEFYNGSELLQRVVGIRSRKSLSRDKKFDIFIHLKSIECSQEELPNDIGYIILDDVTTSGTTFKACKNILIEHGAEDDNIVCLALAKTIDRPNIDFVDDVVILKRDLNGF